MLMSIIFNEDTTVINAYAASTNDSLKSRLQQMQREINKNTLGIGDFEAVGKWTKNKLCYKSPKQYHP